MCVCDYFVFKVAQVDKSISDGTLGVALEGTVDIINGTELRPHHYIQNIVPNGPVAVSGKLRMGDELLEANGAKLYGKSYLEVVKILRELPSDICMVCARRLPLATAMNVYEPAFGSVQPFGFQNMPERIVKVSFVNEMRDFGVKLNVFFRQNPKLIYFQFQIQTSYYRRWSVDLDRGRWNL